MLPAVVASSLVWAVLSMLSLSQGNLYDPSECCMCPDLKPKVAPDGPKPQVMPSPFTIHVVQDEYRTGTPVYVHIKAKAPHAYRAFFIGAYKHPYTQGADPVGRLELEPDQNAQAKEDCESRDGGPGTNLYSNALSNQDDNPKRNLQFKWTANRGYGHIEFRATFVVDDQTYWVSEKSRVVADPLPGNPPLPRVQFTAPINTEQCGNTKGCFREPPGCVEPQCTYILTWNSDDNEFITFELGGLADGATDRYVAFALSDDTYMGDDTVFVCAHNSANQRTEVFLSYNQQDPKKSILIPKYDRSSISSANYELSQYAKIQHEEGSYQNGRLRCRFQIQRDLSDDYPELKDIRAGANHLLFARGFASRGQVKRHGLSVEELPLASEDPIDFSYTRDHSGRANYPLAKAHGCLMILAWIFFASVALIMSKYYTTMWPNKRAYNQRYWFIVHFNCMALMFILSIIGIIIIFIEADGYSEAPDLPQRAHPILGIIILVCIIIIPILAVLRPSEEHKCRPVYNWFYWVFWTIAYVLSIPNIFIGMDFGKVGVPWWATWILVIWVIFHIAVELTLEIHQCCTYKKNKERRKKWEQMKREYPKQTHPEPEPAGRRFKRFLLCLHVCFTALIVFIMIIIIAVS
ncbi:ferric-chelate reductase 1 [Plakobranchus ocellatus]|uniref:Ferric-chelate reductase 1 n=1 Tax=Plakobranchus ocellatus TaxID=259542 RepID=A0AAV4BGW5_9GAST|nr:ferric-chelate reductase 1 [Plakobranchus ocellatus]